MSKCPVCGTERKNDTAKCASCSFEFLLLRKQTGMRWKPRAVWDVLALLLPPVLMAWICIGEQNYEFREGGGLSLLEVMFFIVLGAGIYYLSLRLQESSVQFSLLIGLLNASGPFWVLAVGVGPNPHGGSGLILLIHFFVSLVFGIYWMVRSVWRVLKSRRVDVSSTAG